MLIAQAIVCHPALVVADDPTASLDDAAEREILTLLGSLVEPLGISLFLISHDPAVLEAVADRRSTSFTQAGSWNPATRATCWTRRRIRIHARCCDAASINQGIARRAPTGTCRPLKGRRRVLTRFRQGVRSSRAAAKN